MIHQDDIIKRMESQGADTTIIKSQRGSRIGQDDLQQSARVQQVPPVQQAPQAARPVQQTDTRPNITQEDMQYVEQSEDISQADSQKYAEYKDVKHQDKNPDSNNQQADMMKSFAEDIGKVMGDVIGKIENLNNTVFNLQNELNEVKMRLVQPSNIQSSNIQPQGKIKEYTSTKDFFPDDFEKVIRR